MFYLLITAICSPIIYSIIKIRSSFLIKNNDRFLIIQTGKIGDIVYATSIVGNLKQRVPNAWIAVLTSPICQPLIQNNPKINEVLVFDHNKHRGLIGKFKLAWLLKNKKITCSITLLPNVANTFITLWGLIPNRLAVYPNFIGITYYLMSTFNTNNILHPSNNWLLETYSNLLQEIKEDNYHYCTEIFITPFSKQKVKKFFLKHNLTSNSVIIGLLASSGNKMKQWPKEKFTSLSRLIRKRYTNSELIFIGTQNDCSLVNDIQHTLGIKTINTAGLFPLEDLPALLEKMHVVIGVDSGPIYIANALNIPVIDISGPSNIKEQRPLGKQANIIKKDFFCVPCSHPFKAPYSCIQNNMRCVREVQVEEVFNVVEDILNKINNKKFEF